MQSTQVYDYRNQDVPETNKKVFITMADDEEIKFLASILEFYVNSPLEQSTFTPEEDFASELFLKIKQLLI